MRHRITVVIIAKNEEARIVPCLESIRWCDEIVVVDDMSADSTREICRKFGAKVIAHPLSGDYGAQRNVGIDNSSGDWILQMDADERVSPELRKDIEKILAGNGRFAAYKLLRKNHFLGRLMQHGGWPERQVKLFKKGKARYIGCVHEALKVDGKIGSLDSHLEHYAFSSISQYISRQLYYAQIEAKTIYRDRGKIELKEINYNMKCKPLKLFFKIYIKRMGFRDGMHGFILSILNAWRRYTIWAIYWEKYYKNT